MNFMIIASPRTGSTHLATLLDLQEDIRCNGEIFHPNNILVRWPKFHKTPEVMARLAEMRKRDPKSFLDEVLARSYGCAHVGFKIFSGHCDEMLDNLIADSSIKKVVLFRRNLLAVHSSSLIAHKIGERALRAPRTVQPVVTFEPGPFMAFCERTMKYYRGVFDRLIAARQIFHTMHYEQINDPWFFASLVGFIGGALAAAEPKGRRIKQNSSYILSRFSNPDDAEAFLREHGLMGWCHESEISLNPFPAESPSPAIMSPVVV